MFEHQMSDTGVLTEMASPATERENLKGKQMMSMTEKPRSQKKQAVGLVVITVAVEHVGRETDRNAK